MSLSPSLEKRLSLSFMVDVRSFSLLKGSGLLQVMLHACPTYACGCLRCCGSTPMGFQTYGLAEAGLFECAKLRRPIDEPYVDRRPFNFAIRVLDCIFAMAVMDTILGQSVPCHRECIKF